MPCGVFILWFCWFGFNGGSSLSLSTDASMTMTGLVCFNTNLAAAVATCVTMIFTWVRYGKPDVIVSKISVDSVVEAAKKALYTGHIGDGKIFVYNVTRVVKIRHRRRGLCRAAGRGVSSAASPWALALRPPGSRCRSSRRGMTALAEISHRCPLIFWVGRATISVVSSCLKH